MNTVQDKWEHKYLKYKLKYQQLKNMAQAGGAAKKTAEKKKADKPKKVEKAPANDKAMSDERPSVYIKCVNVKQDKEDLHFEGRVCKTPPLRIRVSDDAKLAKVIKVALRYVTKRARMADVKEVEIVQGKKKEKLSGDKLDAPVDLKKMAEVDEINIFLN